MGHSTKRRSASPEMSIQIIVINQKLLLGRKLKRINDEAWMSVTDLSDWMRVNTLSPNPTKLNS